MVTTVKTVAFQGIEAVLIDVQVQIAPGLPKFLIVGLPDKAVKEAGERVRAALVASGLSLPPKRITINLAPADLPKEGSHYDLPMALGLMGAIGAVPPDAFVGYLALGELGLDGRLAPVSGTLPAAIAAHTHELGIICPEASGPEAAWAGEDIDIIATPSLLALVNHLAGHQLSPRPVARRRTNLGVLPD
ncbi:MAG: magnesium chelatase domain-containing protein, partial [Devosia sp.]